MKLYTSPIGPSPRSAKILFSLKDIMPEIIEVDILRAENRQTEFLSINPAGQLPFVVTEEGITIAELSAIAEYLDEIKPDPSLSGLTATDRAVTRMRMRQCDFLIFAPMVLGYRHGEGRRFFDGRIILHDEVSAPAKLIAQEGLAWLDPLLEKQDYICGDMLTYVDVIFYTTLAFFDKQGQSIDPSLKNIAGLMARLDTHDILGKGA